MRTDADENSSRELKKHIDLVKQADLELKRCLKDAEKALRRAADICVRSGQDSRRFEAGRAEARKAKEIQAGINQFLGRLSSLGSIGSTWGFRGQEEVLESERSRLLKARQEEARKTAAAKARLSKKVFDGTEE